MDDKILYDIFYVNFDIGMGYVCLWRCIFVEYLVFCEDIFVVFLMFIFVYSVFLEVLIVRV